MSGTILVSPAEPPSLKHLGPTNALPEEYGCDFLILHGDRRYGIQRKEYSDFLTSLADGRLSNEISKMASLDIGMLLVEGEPKWTTDGILVTRYGRPWYLKSHHGLLWSVMEKGIWVERTTSISHTATTVAWFADWISREHTSLEGRPKAIPTPWGTRDNRDYQLWILTSLPGIDRVLAGAILDNLGMIVGLRVTEDQLRTVPGLGPKRIKKIMEALNSDVLVH